MLLFLLFVSSALGYCTSDSCYQSLCQKTSFTRGSESCVNVYISDSSTYADSKAVFFPAVDEFTVMSVEESGCDYSGDTGVTISIEVGGIRSPKIHYSTADDYLGSVTAVVRLEDGVVTEVNWDQIDCLDCPDEKCIDSFCSNQYTEYPDCTSEARDIKIFFAWIGTDLEGDFCLSVNSVPSKFMLFGLDRIVNEATEIGEHF